MRSLSAILALVVALGSSLALADDGGWNMPNLNPFSKSSKTQTKSRVSDDSWVSLPKVPKMPGFKSGKSRGRKQPSTFTKMTQGTKNFFGKTYDTLTPWDNGAPKKPPTRMGTRRKPDDSEGGFFSWFGGGEPQEPQTVEDFLRQGRPGFDE